MKVRIPLAGTTIETPLIVEADSVYCGGARHDGVGIDDAALLASVPEAIKAECADELTWIGEHIRACLNDLITGESLDFGRFAVLNDDGTPATQAQLNEFLHRSEA